MSGVRHIKVIQDDDGQRLDRWLKKALPDLPYSLAQKLIRQGQLRIDGKRGKADTRLRVGQDVRIPPLKDMPMSGPKKISQGDAAFIKSLVIYDDGDVIAINKPHGLATQGGTKTRRHVDGLLEAMKNKDGIKPRLVHRLDKDTSGVLLLARSALVAKHLGHSFADRDVKKIYWAVVSPVPELHQGTINAPLVKGVGSNKDLMMFSEEDGKVSITDYAVLETMGDSTAFVAFWPRTGRTHQIRAHAQIMGCPILGDRKYGKDAQALEDMDYAPRLHLHARRIVCRHPVKKGKLDITAPLPPDLVKSWKIFGFKTSSKEDPFEGHE
ncbi:MAG: RluA family pseudouridine synthase [Alphaproteobacteria bacterium]